MSDRINHLAVWVAAIVYFLFGYLWYGVLFSAMWTALMGKVPATSSPAVLYTCSFVLGLILAYATAIALSRRPEDLNLSQGVGFALFIGIAVFGTQTLNQALYEGRPIALWLIDAGYVIVGFALIGAIVGSWKKRVVAATT